MYSCNRISPSYTYATPTGRNEMYYYIKALLVCSVINVSLIVKGRSNYTDSTCMHSYMYQCEQVISLSTPFTDVTYGACQCVWGSALLYYCHVITLLLLRYLYNRHVTCRNLRSTPCTFSDNLRMLWRRVCHWIELLTGRWIGAPFLAIKSFRYYCKLRTISSRCIISHPSKFLWWLICIGYIRM